MSCTVGHSKAQNVQFQVLVNIYFVQHRFACEQVTMAQWKRSGGDSVKQSSTGSHTISHTITTELLMESLIDCDTKMWLLTLTLICMSNNLHEICQIKLRLDLPLTFCSRSHPTCALQCAVV